MFWLGPYLDGDGVAGFDLDHVEVMLPVVGLWRRADLQVNNRLKTFL